MKLLVALDGSEFAEEVLGPAARWAKAMDAEVHLLRVVGKSEARGTWVRSDANPYSTLSLGHWTSHLEYGVAGAHWPGGEPHWTEGLQHLSSPVETRGQAIARVRHIAQDYLDHRASKYFPQGAQTTVIMGDDPAEEILDYARREEIDAIAMTTHGHSGIASLITGSVAQKVLRARVVPFHLLVSPVSLQEKAKAA